MKKAKWCKDTYDYYICASAHITNCTTVPVISDLTQLTYFMNFIEKSANRECPGGLYGCAINGESDLRCRAGAKYFLDKNALTDQAIKRTYTSLTIFSILFFFVSKLID